ncbi:MAG TPA: Holliday junction branch migration protein RuvA [Longimicrobiaceae bacterium]|nr:Holliday junction branch migration protein RuvA [Longimicrobiaceae bacterium]
MISRIHGTLLIRELDRTEVMTPGGVGYEISIPRTVYERLPAPGDEVELFTYHVVREDAHLLFGFLDQTERTVFGRLLGASGVGPRLALALLSALPAERLVRAIRERDVTALTAVSGVGKKTAERLVLDLTGKLDDVSVTAPAPGSRGAGIEEAVRALTVLGYPTVEAERAVREVSRADNKLSAQDLIRAALAHLK